ncbi:MAG: HEAT repeat domain-containing protein [candidate division WOR-3 bacterium]
MKKKAAGYVLLGVVIALAMSFGQHQGQQTQTRKPKWEQPLSETDRQALEKLRKQLPQLEQSDDPFDKFVANLVKVGIVGAWKELLRDPEPKRRAQALRHISPEALSAETAIPAILPLLDDESAKVRVEAASALLRFGSDRGANALLEMLKEKGDYPTSEIISMLTRSQRREAIPLLREMFEKSIEQIEAGKSEEHPAGNIGSVARALADFQDRESYSLFDRYLRLRLTNGFRPGDELEIEAASRLGDIRFARTFAEIFSQTKDYGVKLAAAFALAKLGDESALNYLIEQASLLRGAPEQGVTRRDPEGQLHNVPNSAFAKWSEGKPQIHELITVVRYLGELKATQAFPLLVELASIEHKWALRVVVRSLTLLGDKRAVPVLVKLTDPNHPLRYEAARALVFFDDPEAEQAVRRLYPNEESRAKLIKEAKELGPAEFLRP